MLRPSKFWTSTESFDDGLEHLNTKFDLNEFRDQSSESNNDYHSIIDDVEEEELLFIIDSI